MRKRFPFLPFCSLVILSGCLGDVADWIGAEPSVPPPSTFTEPPVTGFGQRAPEGVWYHDGRLESWTLFLQEISPPSEDAASPHASAEFVPEGPLADDDAVYISGLEFWQQPRRWSINPQFNFGKTAVGPTARVEFETTYSIDSEGGQTEFTVGPGGAPTPASRNGDSEKRWFVAFYAVTTVPGRLTLGLDFGSPGAARWAPSSSGAEPVARESQILGSGTPVHISTAMRPNSTVLVLIDEDRGGTPAWRNLTMLEAPYRIELEGRRTDSGAGGPGSKEFPESDFQRGVGWLSVPQPSVTLDVEYAGPDPPHRVVLLTVPVDLAAWFHNEHDLEGKVYLQSGL